MTSWLYYRHDISVITDHTFDWVCRELALRWSEVNHRHKHFLTEEDVAAGSGYAIAFDQLPSIVTSAASRLARKLNE